jgi:hypothetical protein
MGKRHAFTYVQASSGYKKGANLYDGESYTTSSERTNSNGGISGSSLVYDKGGAEGFSTYSREQQFYTSDSDSDITEFQSQVIKETGSGRSASTSDYNTRQIDYADTGSQGETTDSASQENTSPFSGFTITRDGVTIDNLFQGAVAQYSRTATTARNETEISYSYSYGGTDRGGSYSERAEDNSGRTLVYQTWDDTADPPEEGTTSTAFANNGYSVTAYSIGGGNDGSGSGRSWTQTAEAAAGESTAEYSFYRESTVFGNFIRNGGQTYEYFYHSENFTTTFDQSTAGETVFEGSTNGTSGSSSGTFVGFPQRNTKAIETIVATTQQKGQTTTETESSILGTFFDEEITYRYTKTVSTDTIGQDIQKLATSETATDPWDNTEFQWIFDSTFSATGGVYGFVSNNKTPIETTQTMSSILSAVADSYFYEGGWEPKNEQYFTSRGSDTSVATRESTTPQTGTVEANGSDIGFDEITENYSYYKKGTESSSAYRSHGFLDSTTATFPITTSSIEIKWDTTSERTFTFKEAVSGTYQINDGPTRNIKDNISSTSFSELRTYGAQSSVETYSVSKNRTYYTTGEQVFQALGGKNIEWKSVDNSPEFILYDAPRLNANNLDMISYKSFTKNDEIAFCSVTDTNRQSRGKASPPEIGYTEWFLSTTIVSDIVTLYTKTTRTDDSFFIPQANKSYLNGLIYFPKDKNRQIVDDNSNSMSFDQNNKITQIVNATLSTISEQLTRSTTSNFLRLLELEGGLQEVTYPKSYAGSYAGIYGKAFGGDNAYEDEGTVVLYGDCTATLYDADGGSTEYANQSLVNANTTSTLPTGMLSFSVSEKFIRYPETGKNHFLITSRKAHQSGGNTFTSPSSSYSYYYPPYYYY